MEAPTSARGTGQLTVADLLPYAQLAAPIAAATGLFVTAWQFARSREATTLQNLQEFFKASNEREAALAEAKDDAARRHAFVEYLNFLEVYSAAENGGLFIGVARELVRDKIIDSLVVLDAMPQWHQQIEASISSSVTYSHISEFMARHRRVLGERKRVAAVASKSPGQVYEDHPHQIMR